MDNRKTRGEWTLNDIKSYCGEREKCFGCQFWEDEDCMFFKHNVPEEWKLDASSRFTEQDKQDARAALRLAPDAKEVTRNDSFVVVSSPLQYPMIFADKSSFPSVQIGETVAISDIIGGAD